MSKSASKSVKAEKSEKAEKASKKVEKAEKVEKGEQSAKREYRAADWVDAALKGELKANPAGAGKKYQDALKQKSEDGKPAGRPVGTTTGLPIQGAWCFIFQANEKAPKAKKFTDEQITAWLRKEFPGRESTVFDNVQGVRTKYNKGGLTRGQVPELKSHRYTADGDQDDPK